MTGADVCRDCTTKHGEGELNLDPYIAFVRPNERVKNEIEKAPRPFSGPVLSRDKQEGCRV